LNLDIPAEQLERIQPLVLQLLAIVRRQALRLPLGADSALEYRPEAEDDRE
jgi:hypothetical protein